MCESWFDQRRCGCRFVLVVFFERHVIVDIVNRQDAGSKSS